MIQYFQVSGCNVHFIIVKLVLKIGSISAEHKELN